METTDSKYLIPVPIASEAASGNVTVIPATQAEAGDGRFSVALGYPAECAISVTAGGKFPQMSDANGAYLLLSSAIRALQAFNILPYDATFAQSIGGYPAGAIVSGSVAGTYWVSTSESNVSVPGATGASWKSLFDGYSTQATADGRYVQSIPASGSTSVRVVDVQESASGSLVATMADGTTKNYIPSGQIVQSNAAYAKGFGGNGNIITAELTLTLTRSATVMVNGCANYAYLTDAQSSVTLSYSANGGNFSQFGTSDTTLASCIYVAGTLSLSPGTYTIMISASNGNSTAIGWSAVLSYIAVSE